MKNDAESISESPRMKVEDIQGLPYRDFMVYDDTAESEQVKRYGLLDMLHCAVVTIRKV